MNEEKRTLPLTLDVSTETKVMVDMFCRDLETLVQNEAKRVPDLDISHAPSWEKLRFVLFQIALKEYTEALGSLKSTLNITEEELINACEEEGLTMEQAAINARKNMVLHMVPEELRGIIASFMS